MELKKNSTKFRVIIAGGGVSGLTLANALQHAGIDYILLEARTAIAPQVGAAIAILPNGARILEQLGCYGDILNLVEPLLLDGDHDEHGNYIHPRSDGPRLLGKR